MVSVCSRGLTCVSVVRAESRAMEPRLPSARGTVVAGLLAAICSLVVYGSAAGILSTVSVISRVGLIGNDVGFNGLGPAMEPCKGTQQAKKFTKHLIKQSITVGINICKH